MDFENYDTSIDDHTNYLFQIIKYYTLAYFKKTKADVSEVDYILFGSLFFYKIRIDDNEHVFVIRRGKNRFVVNEKEMDDYFNGSSSEDEVEGVSELFLTDEPENHKFYQSPDPIYSEEKVYEIIEIIDRDDDQRMNNEEHYQPNPYSTHFKEFMTYGFKYGLLKYDWDHHSKYSKKWSEEAFKKLYLEMKMKNDKLLKVQRNLILTQDYPFDIKYDIFKMIGLIKIY